MRIVTIVDFNEIFNPFPGISHIEYIKEFPNSKRKEIFIPEWIDKKENGVFNLKKASVILRRNGIQPQIFYDCVILGLTDESLRPRCLICGKELKFISLGHGYPSTCSKECHSLLKKKSYLLNDKMLKKGDRHSKESRQKIGETLKGRPISDSLREWRSERMKKFSQTEEGKAFYKKVGEINSRSNLKILSGEKSINTETGYYNNKLYKRGIIENNGIKIPYDSEWEKLFIGYLLLCPDIVYFSRCSDRIEYFDPIDKRYKNYIPDFRIRLDPIEEDVIIEIKPSSRLKEIQIESKISAAKEFYSKLNLKFLVLTEKELIRRRLGKQIVNPSFNLLDFILSSL